MRGKIKELLFIKITEYLPSSLRKNWGDDLLMTSPQERISSLSCYVFFRVGVSRDEFLPSSPRDCLVPIVWCFKRLPTYYMFRFLSSLRSKRFQSSYYARTLEREQKKMERGGEGEKRKRLPANPTILENALDFSPFISFVNSQLVKIDNEQTARFEKFTLFFKTRSTRLQKL